MSADEHPSLVEQALQAASAGLRAESRRLFEQARTQGSNDPRIELWLAWLADSPAAGMASLQQALRSPVTQAASVGGLLWLQGLVDSLKSPPNSAAVQTPLLPTSPATSKSLNGADRGGQQNGSVFDFIGERLQSTEFPMAPLTLASIIDAAPSILESAPAATANPLPPATEHANPAAELPVQPALAVTAIAAGVMQLNCPHCYALLQTPESTIGKQKRCPACNQRFLVTEPQSATAPQTLAPQGLAGNVHQDSAADSIYFDLNPRGPTRTPDPAPLPPTATSPVANPGSSSRSSRAETGGLLPESLTSPAGPTVLVVDDSPIVRKVVATVLERAGYHVWLARDGEEALELALRTPPNLVLLDVVLPGIDGYRVCEFLKTQPVTHAVPVLILSGRDSFFDRVRGRLAGCDDYLTKPCEAPILVSKVREYLAPMSAANAAPSATENQAAAQIDEESVFS